LPLPVSHPHPRAQKRKPAPFSFAVASAYSRESSGLRNGCDGSELHDADLSVATFQVPCGTRVQICIGARCVTATRNDSGPYVAGRLFDLNVGVVRALGFSDAYAFGVRTIRWRRAG
jgi:hypothetical protein